MKAFVLAIFGSVFALGFFLAWQFTDGNPILFESLESKSNFDGAVFNRIKFIPGMKRDVWLMQQSHEELYLPEEKWDKLAIVVDKSVSPKVALFYRGSEINSKDILTGQREHLALQRFSLFTQT